MKQRSGGTFFKPPEPPTTAFQLQISLFNQLFKKYMNFLFLKKTTLIREIIFDSSAIENAFRGTCGLEESNQG